MQLFGSISPLICCSKFCKFMFTMPIAQIIVSLLPTWVDNLSCHIFTNLYPHDKCRKFDKRFILMFYLTTMANAYHLPLPSWNSFETKPTVGAVEELVFFSRIHPIWDVKSLHGCCTHSLCESGFLDSHQSIRNTQL